MPQNMRPPAVLAIVAVAVAFVIASADYSIPQLLLDAAAIDLIAILVATVALAAVCLSIWEIWAENSVARTRTRETRTAWFLERETFVDFIDIALAASNQTSPSILLIEVDGLPSTVGVTNTIGAVVHRATDTVVATMRTEQSAVLLRALTSDQVLSIAEEILAAFPATEAVPRLKVSIGVCFCLPSTTAESALGVAENALRLAKRQDGNAWRSIAEGGVRAVSRRPIRAPTLSKGSCGAGWLSP